MICCLCRREHAVTATETHVVGRNMITATFCVPCFIADRKVKR